MFLTKKEKRKKKKTQIIDSHIQNTQRRTQEALESSEEQHPVLQMEAIELARQQITLPPLWNLIRASEPLTLPPLLTTTTTCCRADFGEESQQGSLPSTADTLRPSCSRWELVGQRRPAQGQEKEATGTDLKQQDAQIALQAHPELLNSVPPEHVIALLHCDKPEQQPFFINKDLQHLVPKLSSSDGKGLYQDYKERFVSKMNEVAKQFIGHLYTSQKEAASDFNLFLRSYMPGWVLHSGKTTKSSTTGLVRTVYTCHTVNKKKKSEDALDCGSCKWRAVLQQDGIGAFSFKEISDFNMHRVECVQLFARFTPGEVSFQMDFGPSGRPKVMQHLHQNWVQQDTYKKK